MVGGSPAEDQSIPDGQLDRVRGNGTGIVAFDKFTGAVKYALTNELASYASPVVATVRDRRRGFAFCRGGLVVFFADTGAGEFPSAVAFGIARKRERQYAGGRRQPSVDRGSLWSGQLSDQCRARRVSVRLARQQDIASESHAAAFQHTRVRSGLPVRMQRPLHPRNGTALRRVADRQGDVVQTHSHAILVALCRSTPDQSGRARKAAAHQGQSAAVRTGGRSHAARARSWRNRLLSRDAASRC